MLSEKHRAVCIDIGNITTPLLLFVCEEHLDGDEVSFILLNVQCWWEARVGSWLEVRSGQECSSIARTCGRDKRVEGQL